jgi:hypothetical protein
MQRRHLQIDTNFLEEEEFSPKIHTFAKTVSEEMSEGAVRMDRLLSLILARNVVECWKELKVTDGPYHGLRRTQRAATRRTGKQSHCYQDDRSRSSSVENYVSIKPRSHSQAFINIKTERSLYAQEE